MSSDSQPEPRGLVWLSGFLLGMSTVQAQGFFEATRSELQPRVGRVVATAAGGAALIAWLALISLLVGWFCRRGWVRAWFAAAEQKRDHHA